MFGKGKAKQHKALLDDPLDGVIEGDKPPPIPARQNPPQSPKNISNGHHTSNNQSSATPSNQTNPANKPKLIFHCQLAHGSPTGFLSGFSNVRELYQKIAECYDMPAEDILFCTLNTHKVDMSRLLGGQIGLDDFIFAHRKGQKKEVEIEKTDDALGLTITDNGAGYAFIKRIKEGSVIDRIKCVQVGDHIERINADNLVGCRHYEVARKLKEIPKGSTFTMKLVEPLRSGFASIGGRSDPRSKKSSSLGSGMQTLRIRSNGQARVEDAPDDIVNAATEKINSLLETLLGINDTELALQIWELGQGKTNTMEFAESIDHSDLESFGFPDEFIFELWGVITDAKSGRLRKEKQEQSPKFPYIE
ncbi:unnamed protein product [Cyprideis torosa]|uniref:Uncharacterized protein n=1 Tax=Cyprideis torosa TaxID=163714 RepID=A0A7R8ZMA0_9CRUS|nr:unnamed protein product [Cyprideis torosa]CAG0883898.1 unnamed protein product [Cyprideis torosa]